MVFEGLSEKFAWIKTVRLIMLVRVAVLSDCPFESCEYPYVLSETTEESAMQAEQFVNTVLAWQSPLVKPVVTPRCALPRFERILPFQSVNVLFSLLQFRSDVQLCSLAGAWPNCERHQQPCANSYERAD